MQGHRDHHVHIGKVFRTGKVIPQHRGKAPPGGDIAAVFQRTGNAPVIRVITIEEQRRRTAVPVFVRQQGIEPVCHGIAAQEPVARKRQVSEAHRANVLLRGEKHITADRADSRGYEVRYCASLSSNPSRHSS